MKSMEYDPADPSIRTYKKRGTRVTAHQESSRVAHWDRWGLAPTERIDLRSHFNPASEVILEIGSGMGEATAAMALADSSRGIVASEVHRPGIGALLAKIEEFSLTNVRIFEGDALVFARDFIQENGIDGVRLFFPDPWPKTKHHKRRIFNQAFLELFALKVRAGGFLHVATDWIDYADWISDRAINDLRFVGGRIDRPEWRPLTKFENRGLKRGHEVFDFYYTINK